MLVILSLHERFMGSHPINMGGCDRFLRGDIFSVADLTGTGLGKEANSLGEYPSNVHGSHPTNSSARTLRLRGIRTQLA